MRNINVLQVILVQYILVYNPSWKGRKVDTTVRTGCWAGLLLNNPTWKGRKVDTTVLAVGLAGVLLRRAPQNLSEKFEKKHFY